MKASSYYQLTKPGIVYGNALTVLAGFLFAGRENFDVTRLLATVFGSALVVASSCVINNYIDRPIDKLMARTKQRALVSGQIKPLPALMFAGLLAILGFAVLLTYSNPLTALLGAIGMFDYVVLYGLAKRHGPAGTLVGSVSGAIPILAGYTGAANQIGLSGSLLFVIMTVWQMPHFYAIAIYRAKDYAAAHIPVLPLVRGVARTRRSIVAYMVAYGVALAGLVVFAKANYLFAILAGGSTIFWLGSALKTARTLTDERWARQVFFHSLIVLLALCAGLATQILFK